MWCNGDCNWSHEYDACFLKAIDYTSYEELKKKDYDSYQQVPSYAKHFVKQIDPPFDLHFPSHARGIRATIGSAHLALEENMVLFIVRESPTEMQPDELPGGIENVFSTLIIT